ELLLLERYDVAVEAGVVLQHAPRDRVAIRAYAKKATKLKRRITHLPRNLVDDYVVDRTKLVAVCVVDRRSRDLAGRDAGVAHSEGLLDTSGRVPAIRALLCNWGEWNQCARQRLVGLCYCDR